ncbi:transcription antitermination factor NusB [Mycoplasma suis]|uniref:Transcription antitermination factor NusB n=2 Tax=Mycoplasma suis TaxID=57372 RepID=F0QQX4_MYCSL|nr:transcription antitermination factor NusB [Mycoplasma suis]ADX97894.1 transcription antitermination factor NusB [Mycoplasma suis str. Illinois]CBZ40395.1 Transcription termination factor N-utilization substance protein B [Mycoplasma suis KI3806]
MNIESESSNRFTRLQKRIHICEAIYSDLIWSELNESRKIGEVGKNFWSDFEWRIFKKYIKNKDSFIEQINNLLRDDWDVGRLNLSILAILLEAFSEYSVYKTTPAVLIQQSVQIAKDYGEDEYKLVHAVIDNYIKKLQIQEREED